MAQESVEGGGGVGGWWAGTVIFENALNGELSWSSVAFVFAGAFGLGSPVVRFTLSSGCGFPYEPTQKKGCP